MSTHEIVSMINEIFDEAKNKALALIAERSEPAHRGERMLKASEVAELLSVPKMRVYDLRRQGLLPAVKVSAQQYRWPESSVQRFKEQGGVI